ncbi:class I SAM-dependent methyltransferase [Hydrogenobacter hydrogenophilus]|uniref:Ubiquinone/menaquinone biosynthesis C-methylase UbiE n=1 Tax=Hydrogenobacter hydrogenophilus TaxID=35835 RepID=A0A285NU04_9AQUI|nr:class I SAM-dependent methyltransferase [Hydrogenobacter hydrogenophilus]SNZ11131.1 Ubiquinone/menaquinone biosynthesis C-methylase UbiE [Hydrogenobacter hydrogenophilus]
MWVFDEYAQAYDLWYEKPFGMSAYRLELECLRKLYQQSETSLEIGVGSGRFASALGVRYGVDTSKELLKMALKRGVKGVLGKAEDLPFKEGIFDGVLIVVSLCFFEDPVASLKEANRVLKAEGSLLLGLVLSESPWAEFYRDKAKKGHPIYSSAKFYTYSQIITFLENAGFGSDRVFTTLFEEPQDEKPIKTKEIREGFWKEGGFFCISSKKLSL